MPEETTATLEAPPQTQGEQSKSVAETSIGDVYKQALAKAQQKPAADAPPEKPKAEATKTEPAKADEKKPDAKTAPKSALDAALSEAVTAPAVEGVKEESWKPEAATEDIFKGDKNWKAARSGMEQRDTRITDLQKQVGEFQSKLEAAGKPNPEHAAELTKLREQLKEKEGKLAEYNDAITALSLKDHPDFRREFVTERKELLDDAASDLKAYGGDTKALTEALEIPRGKKRDEAIGEVLEDLSDTARASILRTLAEIDAKDKKAAKLTANPQQSYEALERKHAAERTKQAEEIERVKQSEVERISRDLQKAAPTLREVDASVEGGKEWNDDLKASRERALSLLSDAPPEKIVTAALKGERYDFVVGTLSKALADSRAETAQLREQLSELDKSQPEFRGRGAVKKTPHEERMSKTPGEIFKEQMAKSAAHDEL